MYSIKPGRGPSAVGVVMTILAAVMGILWTSLAVSMGAPEFFVAFGVVFVLLAIGGGIYSLYNATAPNRMSQFDIVRSSEEPDPLAPHQPRSTTPSAPLQDGPAAFCPYCGKALSPDFAFCPKCGKSVRPVP